MQSIRFLTVLLLSSICAIALPNCITPAKVIVSDNGQTITLYNGLVEATFDKGNANLSVLENSKGVSLLGNKGRAYLLGPGFSMSPSVFSIVKQTSDMAEISFEHVASNHFTYNLHYIIRAGVSGVYCFLLQSHSKTDPDAGYGQTRWGISADPNLFDYHLVRDDHQGPMPKMTELADNDKVQDWTYRFPDSTYYTKYDYADYIDGKHVHGMAGQKSGYGLFVIQPSFEYLLGGPTKQFQNVHAGPFLICMFQDGHFLSNTRPDDTKITGDWQKLSGPFLLYVNSGKDIRSVWADAKSQADKEISQWPYTWMNNPAYPLDRGTVTGTLKFVSGTKAANAHVILASPDMDWQAQSAAYMFFTTTDADGNFSLKNVRPGNYCLYAYGCDVTDELKLPNITVIANKTSTLGALMWPVNNYQKLWQIGIADRFTDGFKLSDHPRYYDVFKHVPANLDYTIGNSNPATDWYYAQTQTGTWNILFNIEKTYTGEGVLTVGIAGSAKNPQFDVMLNDSLLGKYYFGNDASVYRSAIRGGYYQKLEVRFPAALLKPGSNKVSFVLPSCKPGGGIMYDVIKLEMNDKASAGK